MKSETEITKGTRKTTLSLSPELIFSEATDKDTTEEMPSVPSLHDSASLEAREEDLRSPESLESSSSGSYSVTTDNSRGEGGRGE